MKNRIVSVLVCVLALLALVPSARADSDFYQHTSFMVGPDFNSGNAFLLAQGANVVTTSLSSGLSYSFDSQTGDITMETFMNLSGVWGDPHANNPYYSLLENVGLHSSNEFRRTEIVIDGDVYNFHDVVSLVQNCTVGIIRNDDHTSMLGYLYGVGEGEGVIPVSTWGSFQIFEPGHPDWLPDWQVNMGSRWAVTTGFDLVPTPGTACLVGLGGLTPMRRRRR